MPILLVKFPIELAQLLNIYDFLDDKRVIFSNVQTDSIFT